MAHIAEQMYHFELAQEEKENIGIINHRIGMGLHYQGDYCKALEYNQKALTIREKVQGTEHPDTATTYNNMALVYQAQGDYPKALKYYQKALFTLEKVLGVNHPTTKIVRNNFKGCEEAAGR
jgi:tetratricopeptide (TPR) repeat protein